jgi:hypothetical protein
MGRITNLGNLGLHLPESSGRFLNPLEPLIHFVELLQLCTREHVSNNARVWVRLANEPARLGSFWLVRITSQLGSALYLNEPESQLGSARYELELAR